MNLIFALELLFLWCSGMFAAYTDRVGTAVAENCGVYLRDPETKKFSRLGSMEDMLRLAPIQDYIKSTYVIMFSNERLLSQANSHDLVELSILAKNATVNSAVTALRGFLYDLPDVVYGVSFMCDAKGNVSVWRIFTKEEFASGIAARVVRIASEHPSSTVKLTYVEKKPFNFELETVEDPYWNLYLRSSTGLKLLSSYSRSGIESVIDNLTRFDELDYSGFVVAKNNECFHKYKEYLPRLRLTIPKDLVRMFLCWPIVEDRNDGEVYNVHKNYSLKYMNGIEFNPDTGKTCFVDYYLALDAPDQAVGSMMKFLIGLEAHQRWKTLLIGTKPYELGINLRASFTGRPVVLSHAPGGLSLMGAWQKGLLPEDPDKSTFVFEFPSAAPSGIKQVGFTIEIPAKPYLKKLLLINTYYCLCHSLFSGFKEFLWKIVIRQVGEDKMQLIWIFSTKTSPGCLIGLDSKQIASVMAQFATFNGIRDFNISEVVLNSSTLKSDRHAKPAIHDCTDALAVFNVDFAPKIVLPESLAGFTGKEEAATPANINGSMILSDPSEISATENGEAAEVVVESNVEEQLANVSIEPISTAAETNAEEEAMVPATPKHLYYILQHGSAGFQIQKPKPDGGTEIEIRFNLEISDPTIRAEILDRLLSEFSGEIYLLKASQISYSSVIQLFMVLNEAALTDISAFKLKVKSQDSRITGIRLFCKR